ncbi:MAG TPA: sugar phosphate isomerase/epimerase [Opitutales bacterium]|nr:sugar phosphate isomerase/epimerase [Opitutales bacterium]
MDIPSEFKRGGFAIGCQAYTFRNFTAFEAIEKTAQAGGRVIEFYPGQSFSPAEPDLRWNHNATDEMIAKIEEQLARFNVKAINYGVVGIPVNEDEARKIFEFAKRLGIQGITTESENALDTIEKLVKEYDIKVAFHNHPRRSDNPNYKMWDPNHIRELLDGRDERIGACADTGHWMRSGLDPIKSLRILEGRIVSLHLKDRNDPEKGHDVVLGTGAGQIPEVLEELRRQNFSGNISVEYEYNWDDSVPDVAQSIGFIDGYGTARGWE